MSDEVIQILIGGKAYALKANDPESLKKLPWSDRKQLIELLENIKQAEYVKAAMSRDKTTINQAKNPVTSVAAKSQVKTNHLPATNSNDANFKQAQKSQPQLDPSIKPSDQDADDLMARLILEQQQHQKPIPDKSAVLRVMLIVFAVIIALMLIF